MTVSALAALLHNAAILLAMVVAFDAATHRQRLCDKPWQQAVVGLVFGCLGIGLIMASYRFETGIVFDTRSVLFAVSGLFLGAIPTAVAMLMTAAYRLSQGGAAAWVGTAVILVAGTLGVVWRNRRQGDLADLSLRELYTFGLVVHVIMLMLMLTLPWETSRRVLKGIALPVLLIYPAATAALGLLLVNRLRRENVTARLAASEEKFCAIANFTVDWESWFGTDGKHLWVNPAVEQFTGYSPEEVLAMPDFASVLIAEEDRSLFAARFKDALCGGSGADFEFRYLHKNGSKRWLSAAWQPIFDRQGNPLGVRTSGRDITERKQAEAELKQKYAELERLNRVTVDREMRMVELKEEVNALLRAEGLPEKYRIVGGAG